MRKLVVALLMHFPLFHHLWFLWFLCWLVVGFAIAVKALAWLPWRRLPKSLVVSPLRYLWLVPLVMIPQAMMGEVVPIFGPDTSIGLIPIPHILLYYALFFGFGTLYYLCGDDTGELGRRWRLTLPLTLLFVLPIGYELTLGDSLSGLVSEPQQRWLSVALQATYACLMTFGLMGACRSLLNDESPAIRYVSDSSYWLYLVHLPLVILVQAMVRDVELPALVKFIVVNVAVAVPLLISYQYLVRYTWIGALLNGPKRRPVAQALALAEDRA